MTIKNSLILVGVLIGLAVLTGYLLLQILFGHVHYFRNNVDFPEQFYLTGTNIAELISEDGSTIKAWIKPPSGDAPVIFGFMGNDTSIGPFVSTLKPYLDQGFGLAALVYRGSSGYGGEPSEKTISADARALYDQLELLMGEKIPPMQRIAYGHSFGTGVAVTLSSERKFGGVILVAAYSSICDVVTAEFRGIPMCLFMYRERYESVKRIAKIKAPLLMLHGEQDKSIEIGLARLLFDSAIQPKRFISYENGTHTNLKSLGIEDDVMSFLRYHRQN